MRWRRLVATPVGTALALTITTLAPTAPAALAASASSPARPGSLAASGDGSEQPFTAPAPSQPPGPLPSIDQLEAQMLSMINAERAAAGVGPVQPVAWAHSVARQHSQDMAAAGDIWHNTAGYITPGRAAMGATYLGENVAVDSTLAADDAILFAHLPHRAITLDGRFNSVGVGIALDAHNWVYLTEDFAQIPGGPSRSATTAHAAPVAAPAAAPPAKAPVAKVPVAKVPVAKVPAAAAAKPQAAPPPPAPVPVAAAALAPPPAPAAAPAAQPITTNPASPSSVTVRANSSANSVLESPTKSSSHSHSDSSGIWIMIGVAGALMAAFWGRRFVLAVVHTAQPPVATTSKPEGSAATSKPPWRQAA